MVINNQSEVINVCELVYRETSDIYLRNKEKMGEAALGYRILYGPPIVRAPILFLGFNPGGDVKDALRGQEDGERDTWPEHCEYAVQDWKLARRLRLIWTPSFLNCTTGLNAVFFRSASVADWRKLGGDLRNELEAFSLLRAERIVRALRPECIVIIGLQTFDRLTTGVEVRSSSRGSLIKKGSIWGVTAYGIMHISGAHISSSDFELIREYLSSNINEHISKSNSAYRNETTNISSATLTTSHFSKDIWKNDACATLEFMRQATASEVGVFRTENSLGVKQMPFVVYSPIMRLYWTVLHAAGLACRPKIITKPADNKSFDPQNIAAYETADLDSLAFAASHIQSGERFSDGFWLGCFERGVLIALLKRLIDVADELPYGPETIRSN